MYSRETTHHLKNRMTEKVSRGDARLVVDGTEPERRGTSDRWELRCEGRKEGRAVFL